MPVALTGSIEDEWVPLSKHFQAMPVQWLGGASEAPFIWQLDELCDAAGGGGDFGEEEVLQVRVQWERHFEMSWVPEIPTIVCSFHQSAGQCYSSRAP